MHEDMRVLLRTGSLPWIACCSCPLTYSSCFPEEAPEPAAHAEGDGSEPEMTHTCCNTGSMQQRSCVPCCLRQASGVDQLVVGAGAYEQQHHRQEGREVEERRHAASPPPPAAPAAGWLGGHDEEQLLKNWVLLLVLQGEDWLQS